MKRFLFTVCLILMIPLCIEGTVRLVNLMYPLERPATRAHQVPMELLDGTWLDGASRFYRYRPSAVGTSHGHPFTVNRAGFRGPEIPARDRTVFRIVVVGDSFTAGVGVTDEECYPRVLEARLREAYPTRQSEVVNLGVEGFETVQEARLLREMIDELQPDLVVVGVFSNDTNVSYRHYLPHRIPLRESLLTALVLAPVYDRLYRVVTHEPTHDEEMAQSLDVNSRDWQLFSGSAVELFLLAIGHTGARPLAIYLGDPVRDQNEAAAAVIKGTFLQAGFLVTALPGGTYQPVSRFETHPNAETHRRYAEALLETIQRHSLLEVQP